MLVSYMGSCLPVTLKFTLHGFRSGAAVSSLADVSLHENLDPVGWKSSRTALH